jgi:predicted component of type VI protein secretion system
MSSRRSRTVDPTSQLQLLLDSVSPQETVAAPAGAPARTRAAKPAEPKAPAVVNGQTTSIAAPVRRPTVRPLQAVPRYLVTRKEAAASLGMSIDTFERRVQPVIKLVPCGQLVLVPLRELERWCEEHAHHFAGMC